MSATKYAHLATSSTLFLLLLLAACTSKAKQDLVTIRGSVKLPAGANSGTLLVGVSSAPFASVVANPLGATNKVVATNDLTQYQVTVDRSELGSGPVQVFGVLNRGFSPTHIPSLAVGDLLGFYISNLQAGIQTVDPKASTVYADLNVNRAYSGTTLSLPVQLVDPANGTFVIGVYCGEITGTSPSQLNTDNLIYASAVNKTQPAFSTTLSFQLFQVAPQNECYLFAFHDLNNNSSLDPGEYYGFYSTRSDNLPSPVDINSPISTALQITTTKQMQAPSAQPIIVTGTVTISPSIQAQMSRFFAVAVKQNSLSFSPQAVSQNVLSFQQITPANPNFQIDLSSSPVNIGDKVTVTGLADNESFGLPSLDNSDGLGLAIANNMLVTKPVQYGVNSGFNVTMAEQYYSGQATINVQMNSAYTGPMLLYAYRGALSLNVQSVDPTAVVGFASFVKSGQQAQSSVTVYGLGQDFPLNLSIIAVQDANNNGKLDPGEVIQMAVNSSGVPQTITVNNGDDTSWPLTYLYTTQIPSVQSMSVSGSLQLGPNISVPFVDVLVAQAPNIAAVTANPLLYVKATQKVPVSTGQYLVPLNNTSLKPGDQVFILAISDDGTSNFPTVSSSTLVGVYQNGEAPSVTLHNGANTGLNITVDKTPYQNQIAITGQITDSYKGSLIAVLYAGSPLDLINQNLTSSSFVGLQNATKTGPTASVTFNQLLTDQPMPLNVIPLLVEDANGNGQADPGEVVYYSNNPQTSSPLILNVTSTGITANFNYDTSLTLPASNTAPLQISGALAINAAVPATGKVYVMALDANIPALTPAEIAKSLYGITQVANNATSYSLDLTKSAARPGTRVIVVGLLDITGGVFPQLTANDVIGFHSGNNVLTLTMQAGLNSGIDVTISQPIYAGQAVVSGTLGQINADRLVLAAYGGELTSMTSFDFDPTQILGLTQIDNPSNQFFQLTVNSFGEQFPLGAYIIGFGDANHNQQLDPGETIYYYTSRADGVPEKVTLQQGQSLTLNLNQSLVTEVPSGNNMALSGAINWQPADVNSTLPAYLFVAKGSNVNAIMADPLHSIHFLSKLEGRPTSYNYSLASTDLNPGDSVLVGVWIDVDGSLAPDAGDHLGIALSGFSYLQTLTAGANNLPAINVNETMYNTNLTLNATLTQTPYTGRVLAFIYNGPLNGLSFSAVDPTKIAGFADFQMSAGNTAFQIPLLPTASLPLSGATVIALLDANGNGQPDPGEQIAFASAQPGSFPETFNIGATYTNTLNLNSYYRLPVPSGVAMTAQGTIAPNFANSGNYPLGVALFRSVPFSQLAQAPLASLEAYQVLSPGTTSYSFDLSTTDLQVGDHVIAVAFQNPVADPTQQLQLADQAQIGALFNSTTYATDWPLTAGVNDFTTNGYSFLLNRLYYAGSGTITVNVGANSLISNGAPLVLAAYEVDTSNQTIASLSTQLSSIDLTKVVAYTETKYSGAGVYTIPILGAYLPGFVDNTTRTVSSVIVAGFIDANGNGKLDSGETISLYSETAPVPTFVNVTLAQTQLSGSIAILAPGQAQPATPSGPIAVPGLPSPVTLTPGPSSTPSPAPTPVSGSSSGS